MTYSFATLVLLLSFAVGAHAVTFRELISDAPASTTVVYKQVGESKLQLHIFDPAGTEKRPSGRRLPVVLLIHGGGWVAGGPEMFFAHARYFASRGVVAASVQYRLQSVDSPTRLPDQIDDCAAAVRYLREHANELGIDPTRIAAMGDSAGGHLAASLLTLVPAEARVNAGVLCNPITDLTDGQWFKFAVGGAYVGKKPPSTQPTEADLQKARAVSPLTHIQPGTEPILAMHGSEDRVVLPEHSRKFVEASKSAGHPAEFVLIDGARHAFVVTKYTATEGRVVEVMRKIDAFLVSIGYLSGEATLEASNPPAWEVKGKK